MKTKLTTLVAAALFLCGVAVYAYTSSDAASSELSISSGVESTPLACGEGGCAKKTESDKSDNNKCCPKSGCDKSKSGCDKSKSECEKSKSSCPKSK